VNLRNATFDPQKVFRVVALFCKTRGVRRGGRPTTLRRAFHLLARHRADVWDFPADAGERLHDSHDENNKKRDANQCPDDPQDDREEQADCRDGRQNSVGN